MFARRLKDKTELKCEPYSESRLSLVPAPDSNSDADHSKLVERACPATAEPVGRFCWLKDRLAFVSMASAAALPFAFYQFMVSYLNFSMSGVQTNEFMESTSGLSCAAVCFLMVCTYEYARTLTGYKYTWFSLTWRTVALACVVFTGWTAGLSGVLTAIMALALVFAAFCLGRLIRAAVPPTFNFRRSIWKMGWCSAPGFLFLLSFVVSMPNREPSGTTYANGTAFEFFFMSAFFFLLLSIPTYAAMRAARSRETAPLALLAGLYQAPFFLATILEASLVVFKPGGLTIAVSIFLCNLIAGAILLFSAGQAARANGAVHDRRISGSN